MVSQVYIYQFNSSMAADIKIKYGTSNQAITITLASLASDVTGARTGRESTAIDNTSNLFLDALIQVIVKTGASGTAATGHLDVYAYGTSDGGTTYSGTATGTDAGITLTDPPNQRLIGVINTVANATSYKSHLMSVAAAFGGLLPAKWGICIINESGGTLDTTGSNHSVFYQGVLFQSA